MYLDLRCAGICGNDIGLYWERPCMCNRALWSLWVGFVVRCVVNIYIGVTCSITEYLVLCVRDLCVFDGVWRFKIVCICVY